MLLTLLDLALGNSVSLLGDDALTGRKNLMQTVHIGGLYTNGRGDFLESHFVIYSIEMLCNIIYSFITADGQAYILVANEVSAYAHIVRILELSTVRIGRKYLFSVYLMSA